MSAMHQEDRFHDGADTQDGTDEAMLSSPSVVVRRNAGLAALVGGAACAIAIAYLWRAVGSGAPLDWLLCALMAGVGGYYLSTLLDARTPLVVADPLGVRIRLGRQWRGLPWDAVAAVELLPRGNAVRDGRLVFRPHSLPRALEGLEPRGRRAARLNQKLYGGALAVPLGLTTRSGAGSADLLANLAALCDGRSEVVLLQPEPSRRAAARTRSADTEPTEPTEATEATDAAAPVEAIEPGGTRPTDHARDLPVVTALSAPPEPAGQESRPDVSERPAAPVSVWAPVPPTPAEDRSEQTDPDEPAEHGQPTGEEPEESEESAKEPVRRPGRRTFVGNLGTIVSRVAKGRGTSSTAPAPEGAPVSPEAPAALLLPAAVAAPLRMPRPGLRAQVTRDLPATGGPVHGATALHADPSADRRGTLPEGRELRRPGSVDLVFEPARAAPSGRSRGSATPSSRW
ncbi:hypothetical protein [Nocardioides mesophilus]|uniref:Uncharacterized protein n=1 Tax=Nocardioides mesophilus TaxID=433659 RepID=A0A7G9R9G4_9ACTN|nr:hypothetical protein [Nocardioides mesophilus]QNN52239.1 hypothetical protein H9L09_17375 [Nocardioides mesophilus]